MSLALKNMTDKEKLYTGDHGKNPIVSVFYKINHRWGLFGLVFYDLHQVVYVERDLTFTSDINSPTFHIPLGFYPKDFPSCIFPW